MNEAKYPSKERVERDGVLVHAEGDDLIGDPDEARRQGYDIEDGYTGTVRVVERVERDGVLVHAEGDIVDEDAVDGKAKTEPVEAATVAKPAVKARASGAKK